MYEGSTSHKCRGFLQQWYFDEYHRKPLPPTNQNLYDRVVEALRRDPEEVPETLFLALEKEIRESKNQSQIDEWSEAKALADWRKILKMSETTWRRRIKDGSLVVDSITPKLCRIRLDTLRRFTG